jgi:FAD:protein FMN transferase
MNRRDFLHPRQLAHSAGQVLGALDPPVTPAFPLQEGPPLLRMAHKAMATVFEVILPFGIPLAMEIGEAAFEFLDELEQQLTVYRDTSEVSRLNRLAPYQSVPVDGRLFELLEQADLLTTATDGAFDVTAGALIKAWGFFKGPPRVPSEEERARALERTGMRWVSLAPASRSVRYLRPGLEINFGSIGKGYALDRLAELLRDDLNAPTFLLHGGHSSVYARGSPAGDEGGWAVGIRHPWDSQQRLGVFRLRDQALGTSAATFRHLDHNGRKLGHILDPRTGWPAETLAQVSVIAPSAAEADALATAFYILGIDAARKYCEAHPGVGAVLLAPGDAARPVVLGIAPDALLDLAP